MLTDRNRELLSLIPAALLVVFGFTAVYLQVHTNAIGVQHAARTANLALTRASAFSFTYGALFLGLCAIGHLVLRWTAPYADPYLFPLTTVLIAAGLVMLYRINPSLAARQSAWVVVGIAMFSAIIILLRRRGISMLMRYRYTIAAAGIAMTLLPRLPVVGGEVNGAYLETHLGPISFQPAEFAKVAIVIFLASYLADNRQMLVTAGRRTLGVTLPPMKQFGPILLVWGAAMATLVITGELGTSIMFYSAFMALLYVATGRLSFPIAGVILFVLGSWLVASLVPHVEARISAWERPFSPELISNGTSYQLSQSLFAQADGGVMGVGLGRSLLRATPHGSLLIPFAESDMIYAVLTDELGLVGAAGILAIYLLFVARGLKTASLARDSFSKLLSVGLSLVVAVQVIVIVGGATDLIPLTGVTLPFIAYGGSSVVINFVIVALLLVTSNRARRPTGDPARKAAMAAFRCS